VRSNELRRIQKTRVSNTSSKQGGSLVSAICYNYKINKRKGKPKMSKMKQLLDEIINCDLCNGKGWQFFGNAIEYDVEACECNPNELEVNY
jgi:hypothetical protein